MSARVRLDKLLANLGYGSRRDVNILVRNGKVTLDGAVLKDSEQRIETTTDLPDRLAVLGERLDPLPGLVLMLHKPVGFTCSHNEAGPLVYGLLPERWQRRDPPLSTAGRLDKDTSGLLLLTDDGPLLHRLISPRANIPKTYLATLDRPLRGEEAAAFASGTMLLKGEDRPLLPARLDSVSESLARVTVTEGRYHQVRRMFAAMGNHVTALHRERFGALRLPPDLDAGAYRVLSAAERAALAVAVNSQSPATLLTDQFNSK